MTDTTEPARARGNPTHGWTKHGHAVHTKVIDHMPTAATYQRANKKLALALTQNVGTMTCFWVFCVISLSALPATLVAAKVLPASIGFIAAAGFILCITWISQNFIQLVLLPALMVGQNLQNEAADVRAAKTFEDTEVIVDRLDERTEGGIKTILDRLDILEAALRTDPRR
jgi:hypothetical protein